MLFQREDIDVVFETRALVDTAIARTGLSDFGAPDYLEALNVLVDSLKQDAWPKITPIARRRLGPMLVDLVLAIDLFVQLPVEPAHLRAQLAHPLLGVFEERLDLILLILGDADTFPRSLLLLVGGAVLSAELGQDHA